MDRWVIYELLKGNRKPGRAELLNEISRVSDSEIREGVLEFLLSPRKSNIEPPLSNEIDNVKGKIIKELEQGKDVTLKNTISGLKVQSVRIKSLK